MSMAPIATITGGTPLQGLQTRGRPASVRGMASLLLPAIVPVLVLVTLLLGAPGPALAGPTQGIGTATSGADYEFGMAGFGLPLAGLQAPRGTDGFSVTAHGICRYIDVGMGAPGVGILVPFGSASEWIGGGGGDRRLGFIATAAARTSYLKLDFCRPHAALGTVDFGGPGGLSIFQPTGDPVLLAGNARTGLTPGRSQGVADAELKRVDTRSDPAFAASLAEQRPQAFSLSRQDCLGPTVYPDASVRNPCFTWSWTETITALFTDNIGYGPGAAAAAAVQVPVINQPNNWGHRLERTDCSAPTAVASDGHTAPALSCPPPVTPPTLGNCTPARHDTKEMKIVSTGNTYAIHTCGGGEHELAAGSYTYDLQGLFWCFDGVTYPPTTTGQVNVVVVPSSCAPIVNGQVGPLNGASRASLAAGTAGLCNAGTVDAFTEVPTGWTWVCRGSYGTDANGSANRAAAYAPRCNNPLVGLGGSGKVTMTCDKFNRDTLICEGTQAWTGMIDGGCCVTGQLNNQNFNVNGLIVPGCNPACVPGVEQRTSTPCPAGQTGTITEERNTNLASVCGNHSPWTTVSNTCAAAACVAGWGPERIIWSEDRYTSCLADVNVSGHCTEGENGHAASTKGRTDECATRITTGFGCDVWGRYCGNIPP